MSASIPQRILVIRPDRIGDVVLSTPVLEALKRAYPEARVDMLVRDPVQAVVENNPHVDKIIVYQPSGQHRGFAGTVQLAHALKAERYDLALVLQAQFSVSLAVFLAGIPRRVGPYSKPFSFFLFNEGLRQKRSRVEKHEAEYNLELLNVAVEANAQADKEERISPRVGVDASALAEMKSFIVQTGLQEGRFVVIHPGMGGSALNWPQKNYSQLAVLLTQQSVPVLLSGASSEKALLEDLQKAVQAETGKILPSFVGELSSNSLKKLTALYSLARVIVAPSTGPLHIAVGLDKSTVSFYPPIKVQSVKRWGPYSASQTHHFVLHPEVDCKEDFKCAGQACPHFFCMETLKVEDALAGVLKNWSSSP